MQDVKPKRQKLINLREDKNLNQSQIAENFDITREYYSMLESNKRNPSLNLAKRISDFFNVSVEEIF